MSAWRDMERRHATMQLRKMQAALDETRKVAGRARRFIRYYQRKIDDYEWELQFSPAYLTGDTRDSMSRAVDQLKRMQATQIGALEVTATTERRALENIQALGRQLENLNRWDRWADLLEEWFWPVTILRAIWVSRAAGN